MAAGLSRRFGREDKLLHLLAGQTVLERTLSALPVPLFARSVAVVSSADVAKIAERSGFSVVWNPHPERGQGGSIALGTARMAGLDAAMYCVADQPFLTSSTVRTALSAYAPDTIQALAFAGKRGNPVIFPADCFPALMALPPSETGRHVIRENIDRLVLHPAASAQELSDIDTPEDIPK